MLRHSLQPGKTLRFRNLRPSSTEDPECVTIVTMHDIMESWMSRGRSGGSPSELPSEPWVVGSSFPSSPRDGSDLQGYGFADGQTGAEVHASGFFYSALGPFRP